jgi:hypothetical protein
MNRETGQEAVAPGLSKRAARRLIQRAFVLVVRTRAIRQPLRDVDINTWWLIEDWGLDWTIVYDHGKLEYHRGKAGKPHLIYTWRTAEDFLKCVENCSLTGDGFECEGDLALQRISTPVFKAFLGEMRELIRYPVDADGESLV